jgi:hypothetical protein
MTIRFNWAHAVDGQWGIINQKMKKGAEGTNTHPGASNAVKTKC